MAYIQKNWPIILRDYLVIKCGEEVGNKIMEKIAGKLGLDWDSVSSFTAAGKIVTGTNILAYVASALSTILMGIHYTASMPAINSTTAIVKTGRVWFDNPPKNPNNPNIDADKYVEFLVFSWVYSYLTTGRQYAEPIYQF